MMIKIQITSLPLLKSTTESPITTKHLGREGGICNQIYIRDLILGTKLPLEICTIRTPSLSLNVMAK
jgi:hypothetical protein